jgi:hypothetical protein
MKDGDIIQIAHVVRDSMVRGKPSDHEYFVAVTWSGGSNSSSCSPYVVGASTTSTSIRRAKASTTSNSTTRIARPLSRPTRREESLGYTAELGNGGAIREPERRFPG